MGIQSIGNNPPLQVEKGPMHLGKRAYAFEDQFESEHSSQQELEYSGSVFWLK